MLHSSTVSLTCMSGARRRKGRVAAIAEQVSDGLESGCAPAGGRGGHPPPLLQARNRATEPVVSDHRNAAAGGLRAAADCCSRERHDSGTLTSLSSTASSRTRGGIDANGCERLPRALGRVLRGAASRSSWALRRRSLQVGLHKLDLLRCARGGRGSIKAPQAMQAQHSTGAAQPSNGAPHMHAWP